ncbi:hypothetical protein [Desulfoplanes sp.]
MGAFVNLPVMLNQAPHVQKVQHGEQSHPEQQQVLTGQETVEKQKREQSSVPKATKGEGGLSVKKDNKENTGQSFSQEQKKEPEAQEEEQTSPTGSGRIINLTV